MITIKPEKKPGLSGPVFYYRAISGAFVQTKETGSILARIDKNKARFVKYDK